jgi:hypothetical protein
MELATTMRPLDRDWVEGFFGESRTPHLELAQSVIADILARRAAKDQNIEP